MSGSTNNLLYAIPKIIRKIDEALVNDGIPDLNVKMLILSSHIYKVTSSITNISYKCRCRLRILNDKNNDNDEDTVVTIEGSLNSKEEAVITIFEILEKDIELPQRRESLSPRRDEKPAISVSVPDNMVARLIGRGGEQVKNMMDFSKCSITFHKTYEGVKTPEGDRARLCTLKGTTSSIASAIRILLENVNKLERD